MKKIRFILGILFVTCITSIINIKADSFRTYTSINIPRLHGIYTTDSENKKTISPQYVKMFGCTDGIDDNTQRAVEARLKGITKKFVTLSRGNYTMLESGQTSLGEAAGSYRLEIRLKTNSMTSGFFSGTWVLDDFLKNKI